MGFLILMMFIPFILMLFTLSRSSQRRQTSFRTRMNLRDTTHSDAEIAVINSYLQEHFQNGQYRLPLGVDTELFLRSAKYRSLDDVDVYVQGRRYGTLYEYRIEQGYAYNQLIAILLQQANQMQQQNNAYQNNTYQQNTYQQSTNTSYDPNVIDAEVEEVKPAAAFEAKTSMNQENYLDPKNEKYINELDELNLAIPDEEISTKMYETTALLKQLDFYQKRFPNNNVNFDKMYEYYLPLLISILNQYKNLQVAKNDENYNQIVENLKKTLTKVNQALKKMIEDMTDEDFLNLSVDMSTLEALLKKDGYDTSNQIKKQSGEQDYE